MPKKVATTVKRGPKPETLKIEGKWEDAVKQSLEKKNQLAVGRRIRRRE